MKRISDEEIWAIEEPCLSEKPCPFGIADEPAINDNSCELCSMQAISQATITNNERKFGKLYRRKE